MAVTAHFINEDWQYTETLLDFIHLESSKHTGKVMATKLYECLVDFGIERKIIALVSDNASSMYKLAEQLESLIPSFDSYENHIGCVNHILNLAVKNGLKAVGLRDEDDGINIQFEAASIIDKIRQLAKYVRSSPQRRQQFLSIVDTEEGHRLILIKDVTTRWNSVYAMLARALRLQKAIKIFISINDLRDFEITEDEWHPTEAIVQLLQTFNDLTTEFSASKYPTISIVHSALQILTDDLVNITVTGSTAELRSIATHMSMADIITFLTLAPEALMTQNWYANVINVLCF